eukprot:1282740-Alexandrium_andersonii.AAC.1
MNAEEYPAGILNRTGRRLQSGAREALEGLVHMIRAQVEHETETTPRRSPEGGAGQPAGERWRRR